MNISKDLMFGILTLFDYPKDNHWYETMEYHKTNSLLHVQERLGHISVLTTTIYTHLVNFDADSYYSETAQTIEEARKLVETGFQCVCDVDGFKLFRKLK